MANVTKERLGVTSLKLCIEKQFGQNQSYKIHDMLSNILVFISTKFEILLATVHLYLIMQ